MDNIEEARHLRKAGLRREARDILLKLAGARDISAMVELAYWAADEGDKVASDGWVQRAEDSLREDDWDGHSVLNTAYTLGFGKGTSEEIKKKALAHLEVLARAGNPVAQERLAVDYLHGTNGCRKDSGLFESWIAKAVAQESVSAAMWYAEFLVATNKAAPAEVVALLEAAKSASKDAEKLLRQLVLKRQ